MSGDRPKSVAPTTKRLLFSAVGILLWAAAASSAQAEAPLPAEVGGVYRMQVTSWRELPFRTVLRQKYDFSCGSAALATLLRYHYGREAAGEAEVFKAMYAAGDQAKIKKVGFSLLDMKSYLNSIGIKADGFKVTLDQMAGGGRPAIVVMQLGAYKHFVVVKGYQAGRVLVGDPAAGLKSYRRSEFEKAWNGLAFVIRPEVSPGVGPGRFNRADEWGALPGPSISLARNLESGISDLGRQLPATYQISVPVVTPSFTAP